MSFTYSTALQGRIAFAVWNVPYSSLNANQKAQVDNTWSSGSLSGGVAYDAYNEVAQIAQWFEQASSAPDTSFPQPAWDRLFIAKAALYLVKTVRPDRVAEFQRDHETALDEALDTYTSTLISSSTIAGQAITVAGIRSYVANHCVKRKESGANQGLRRRIFPNIADIDSHIQWTINYLWNMAHWNFRAREVTLTITPLSVSGATWTESTKTVTKTDGITVTFVAGWPVFVTGGTGATTGTYAVNTQSSDDSFTLVTSIGDDADGQTDISFRAYGVTLRGLASGETFDSLASVKFFYTGDNYGQVLEWVDKNESPGLRAYHGSTPGLPGYFRTQPVGQNIVWHLYPIPDNTYTLAGTVFVSTPTLTTLADINTALGLFPAEFGTVIRELVLGKTLLQHAASDAEHIWSRAIDQAESLCPTYTDQGVSNRDTSVRDVYQDHTSLLNEGGMGGGFGYGY